MYVQYQSFLKIMLIDLVILSVILTLRTWAVWGKNKHLAYALGIFALGNFVAEIVITWLYSHQTTRM